MQGARPTAKAIWGSTEVGRDSPICQRPFEVAAKEYAEEHGVTIKIDPNTKQIYFDTDDIKKIGAIVTALETEFGDSFE